MKNVVIIGKNSYIGESFKKWLEKFPDDYKVEIVSSFNHEWKKADFSKYEIVVDFAGIAHIKHITDDMRDLFYSVNRDLSIEIASWSKSHGIKHFIFFSSMNVYGDFCDNITDIAKTKPSSFYGDSKLQGDLGIQKLAEQNFAVSILRPPFVYGKGCSGNYNTISKIAKSTLIFPTYKNKKSMIYIDNLCEFVRLLIDDRRCGIFIPQNKELVSTADLVREIAIYNNHKIWYTSLFNWLIKPICKVSNLFNKAFADDCCDLSLSSYYNFEYCIVSFSDSINYTEN